MLQLVFSIMLVAFLDLYVLDRKINGGNEEEEVPTTEKIIGTSPASPDRTLTTAESSQLLQADSPSTPPLPTPSTNAPRRAMEIAPLPRSTTECGVAPPSPPNELSFSPIHYHHIQSVPNRIFLHELQEPSPLVEPNGRKRGATHYDDDANPIQRWLLLPEEEDEASLDSWKAHFYEAQQSLESPQHHPTNLSPTSSQEDNVLAAAERLEELMVLQASVSELTNLYLEKRTLEDHWKKKLFTAACIIQRAFRIYYHKVAAKRLIVKLRRQLREQQDSAKRIQRLWRDALKRKHGQEQASVVLQRCLRGYRSRQRFGRQVQAIIKLQAWSRMSLCQVERRQRLRSIICIQQVWRSYVVKRNGQSEGCILVQRHYRGYRSRKKFVQHIKAVIHLQTWGRNCLLHQRKVQQTRVASIIIQRAVHTYHRRALANRFIAELRRQLQAQQDSAKRIQALWRDALNRKHCQEEASVVLQRCLRGYRSRQRVARRVQAAIKLQAWSRMSRCQQARSQTQRSILCIQKVWRSFALVRKCQTEGSIMVQRHYRGYRARRTFIHQGMTVMHLQTWYRRCLQERKRVGMVSAAATLIQTVYRGHKARLILQDHQLAAGWIQRWVRGVRDKSRYHKVLNSVVICQAFTRTILAKAKARTLAANHKATAAAAALTIQAWSRASRYQVEYQRSKRAVLKIQTWVRMHQEREKYLQLRTAAVLIQSVQRSISARRLATKRYASIFVIQLFVREVQARNVTTNRGISILEYTAAAKIQAFCRAKMCPASHRPSRRPVVRFQPIQPEYLVKHMHPGNRTEDEIYSAHMPSQDEDWPTPTPDQKQFRRRTMIEKRGRLNPAASFISIQDPFAERSKPVAVSRSQGAFRSHFERQNDGYGEVSIHDQLAATTIQTLVRGYFARKYLTGLRHPLIDWCRFDSDDSKTTSLLDNHDDSNASYHSLDTDSTVHRHAMHSIIRPQGELSTKGDMAASTLQNAFIRYHQTPPIPGHEMIDRARDEYVEILSCAQGNTTYCEEGLGTMAEEIFGDIVVFDEGAIEIMPQI